MEAFDASQEERYEALAVANDVRHERALLRKKLKAGEINIHDIFAMEDDPTVGRMKVAILLESMPGFGKAKTTTLMKELKIAPTRRIQGLGPRQRRALIDLFG